MLISVTPFHVVAQVLFSMKPSNRNFRENHTSATSWKGVMESDTGGASRKSRDGMRHGKHDPSSVTEKASWKAS